MEYAEYTKNTSVQDLPTIRGLLLQNTQKIQNTQKTQGAQNTQNTQKKNIYFLLSTKYERPNQHTEKKNSQNLPLLLSTAQLMFQTSESTIQIRTNMNTPLELQYKAVISTQTCVAKAFVDVNLHYCNISICSNDLNLRLLLRDSNAEVKKWFSFLS